MTSHIAGPQDDSALFASADGLSVVVSGGKERTHPSTMSLSDMLSNMMSGNRSHLSDTPLNTTTSITFRDDGSAQATNVDHGRRLGWRAEHTCSWLPDASGKMRLMSIGGYEDSAHLNARSRWEHTRDDVYKQDLHEYVPGIGWVKWRTTGDMFRPGAQYWMCVLGSVVYCGGGYGNLQEMNVTEPGATPMLFPDVFEIRLLDTGVDRVQACINLLNRTNENFSILHAASTIESWATIVTSSGDFGQRRLDGDHLNADGSPLYVRVPKDERIRVSQWILIWSALARALAETRLVTDPESTARNRKKAVLRLAKVFGGVCELFNHGTANGLWTIPNAQILEHAEGLEKLVTHLAPARNKGAKGAPNPHQVHQPAPAGRLTADNLDCYTLVYLVHALGVVSSISMALRERHALLRTLAEFVKSPPPVMCTLQSASWRIIANALAPSNIAAGYMSTPAHTAEGGYDAFTAGPRFAVTELAIIPALWAALSSSKTHQLPYPQAPSQGETVAECDAFTHAEAITAAIRLFHHLVHHTFCHEELARYANALVFERLAKLDVFRDHIATSVCMIQSTLGNDREGAEPSNATKKLLRTLSDPLILCALKAVDLARPSHAKSASRAIIDEFKRRLPTTSNHCPAQLHGNFAKEWTASEIMTSPPCAVDPTLANYAQASMVTIGALMPNGLLKLEMRRINQLSDLRGFESIDTAMWAVLHKLAGGTSEATRMIDDWRKAYNLVQQALACNSTDPRKLELAEQAIATSPLCTGTPCIPPACARTLGGWLATQPHRI